MKKIMSLVLILALVLSLGACGSKEAAPSADSGDKTAAQEPVELEFIQWWTTEGGGEFLEDLVKRFEEANPGITVKLTSMPFGEIRTQVVASQATGMTPDLIGMNPPWTREFYDMGILAPLDDLMAADPFFKKDNYFQASMAFFLFYNKTMFKEAGIEPPTTWDELVEAAKALTVPEKNQYGITMSMSEQEASNGAILSLYPLLYAQNGRTLVDGKYTVETEGMENAMKLLETLSKNGSILPGTTTRSEFQIIEEFAAGNVGMVISHNGHINTVTNRDPNLEFGIVPLPSVDGKGTVELRHHGWDIGIAANSQHKEEAWKFISFLLNAENVEAMCNEMLKVPAMYGISVNYLDKYPVVKDAIDYMNEYEMVEELMAMPKSATCWVELTKAGSAVIQGTKTTEEALPEVQEAWNRILGQ